MYAFQENLACSNTIFLQDAPDVTESEFPSEEFEDNEKRRRAPPNRPNIFGAIPGKVLLLNV